MALNIVLGVTGGIAAYKAVYVCRLLAEAGHDVRVIPTPHSLKFVGAATWEALSHHPVSTDIFENIPEVQHVALGQRADGIVVVPATADFLAKTVAGMADTLLGSTILASTAPVVVAPAMHTEMWHNPAVRQNVDILRSRGVTVIEPAVGRLTGKDSGVGRLPEPVDIVAQALAVFEERQNFASSFASESAFPEAESEDTGTLSLAGKRILVTAGGTREPIDPVRFIGNRSSGLQGISLAVAARDRGAQVTLVAAHCDVPLPQGVEVVHTDTAANLKSTVDNLVFPVDGSVPFDIVVMAAAVADYRPVSASTTKIKKTVGQSSGLELFLEETEDILAGLVRKRDGQQHPFIAGFAAETGDASHDVVSYAREKMKRKQCDILIVNSVADGAVFGQNTNRVILLNRAGEMVGEVAGDKEQVAREILQVIATDLSHV